MKVKVGSSRRPIRQTVRVHTNIPEHETLTLAITANVLTDIDVLEPNILRFDNRQTVPQVIVKNFTDSPIEIVKVVSPREYVNITVPDNPIPAQGEIFVSAELLPEAPNGVISEWAELHTNLASQPVVYIRVWANLQTKQTK